MVANILTNPLKVLAPLLASLTRDGGQIVLSGILGEQAADVAGIYGQGSTAARPPWKKAGPVSRERSVDCHYLLPAVRHALPGHPGAAGRMPGNRALRCCRTVFNAIQTQQGEQQLVPVQRETDVSFHATLRVAGAKTAAAGSAQDRHAGFQPKWGWLLIMALLVAAQALYLLQRARRTPAGCPASPCWLLQPARLHPPAPAEPGQLRIVSSAMESAPKQLAIVTLYAILHNRATHAQSYPDLELTLTDTSNEALARRTFTPDEYLRPEQDAKQGIPASEEIAIELYLDTEDLKPAGYRLLLSYS